MGQGPFRVVVVDDAADVRAVVGRQLRLSGRFTVVAEGGSGADAIGLAAEHQPDLVLLDASMPDVDGLEALPRVREAAPAAKVVMLTGFGGSALEHAARAVGAADFVDKAAPLRDLPARLLRLLDPGGDAGVPVAATDAAAAAAGEVTEPEAEAVMAEHLERFRTVFEQAAIGMSTLTLSGTIVRVNPALALLLGDEEAAAVGRPYAEVVAPDAVGAIAELVAAVGCGRAAAGELEHRLGRGTRWAHSTIGAVRDPAGRPLYLFAQTQDVTRRRQAINELRVSEERFRLLVEGVKDYAIFMLDPDGRITTWNLGAARMKGYSDEEIIGQHFRVFYPEAARAVRHPENELEIAVREGRYEEEGWRVRKDGSLFWANVVITALFDASGKLAGFAKVTRDVTERRAATEANEHAAAELADANRRLRAAADKTAEFVAVTAHELQSPVAAMTGGADILLEHWDALDGDERADTLQSILRGGARIRRLLGDLLTASRLEAGSFELVLEDVPLRPVLGDVVAEVAATGPVEVDCDDAVAVRADRTRLVQIVTNLVANAGKHGRPPVRVEARRAGPSVEIRVRDGGPGVPDDLVPRLFDKFARAPRRVDAGSGLGLFIVRELARAQHGDAWYERDGGGGSTFAVSLPAPR